MTHRIGPSRRRCRAAADRTAIRNKALQKRHPEHTHEAAGGQQRHQQLQRKLHERSGPCQCRRVSMTDFKISLGVGCVVNGCYTASADLKKTAIAKPRPSSPDPTSTGASCDCAIRATSDNPIPLPPPALQARDRSDRRCGSDILLPRTPGPLSATSRRMPGIRRTARDGEHRGCLRLRRHSARRCRSDCAAGCRAGRHSGRAGWFCSLHRRVLRQACSSTAIAVLTGRRRDSSSVGGLGGVLHEASGEQPGQPGQGGADGRHGDPLVSRGGPRVVAMRCRSRQSGRPRSSEAVSGLDRAALCLALDPRHAEELVQRGVDVDRCLRRRRSRAARPRRGRVASTRSEESAGDLVVGDSASAAGPGRSAGPCPSPAPRVAAAGVRRRPSRGGSGSSRRGSACSSRRSTTSRSVPSSLNSCGSSSARRWSLLVAADACVWPWPLNDRLRPRDVARSVKWPSIALYSSASRCSRGANRICRPWLVAKVRASLSP